MKQDLHLQLLSCVILDSPPGLSEPPFLVFKGGKMAPNLPCGLNRSVGGRDHTQRVPWLFWADQVGEHLAGIPKGSGCNSQSTRQTDSQLFLQNPRLESSFCCSLREPGKVHLRGAQLPHAQAVMTQCERTDRK